MTITSKLYGGEMTKKEDLRVRKTKKALHEAFLKLLSEKTFEEITINELCALADVRRATFYKHYADKLDFLTAYTHTLRDRFDNVLWKPQHYDSYSEYYVAYAKRLVGYISENSAAFENIVKSNLFNQVISVIIEENYKATKERLEQSANSGMKLYASVETLASMCSGGIACAIYNWMLGGRKKSPDELAEEIGAATEALLEAK